MRVFLFCLFATFCTAPLCAEPVQIPGPQGPLEGEYLFQGAASRGVLIIPGSGPVNRDGNLPQTGIETNMYLLLTEGLAATGIASLRPGRTRLGELHGTGSGLRAIRKAGWWPSWPRKLRRKNFAA